jgi:hypothetical protein
MCVSVITDTMANITILMVLAFFSDDRCTYYYSDDIGIVSVMTDTYYYSDDIGIVSVMTDTHIAIL